jgi:hypothetical protein
MSEEIKKNAAEMGVPSDPFELIKMAIVVAACMIGSTIVFKNVLHIKDTLLVGQIAIVPMYLAAGYWAAKGGASNKLWMGVIVLITLAYIALYAF